MKDLKTLRTMINQMSEILDSGQKKRMLGLLVVIIIGAFCELLGVTAMLPFVQSILEPEKLMEEKYIAFCAELFGINSNEQLILFVGVAIIVVYIIKNLFLLWSSYLQASFGCNTQRELSVLMLESYMSQPYSFFLDHNSAEVLRGVNQDVFGVYNVIIHFLKFMSEGLAALLISIGLFVTDASMAVGVVIAGVVSLLIIVFVLKKKVHRLSVIARETNAEKNRWVNESITGIKDVFVYNKKKFFLDKYSESYERGAKASADYNFVSASPERIIEIVCVTGIIAVVLIRVKMGVDPTTFVSNMAMFAMAAFRLMPSFTRIAGNINAFVFERLCVEATHKNIMEARAYLEKIRNISDEIDEQNIHGFSDKIVLSNVTWKYTKSPDDVLKDLDMYIDKGEAIGIIGESGSGKSTLSDILLHLYRPQRGTVEMDGTDINLIPNTWSRRVGYVPQMVFLRDSTVRTNVAFGEENIDDARVWDALEKADLKEFIEGLPDKLDTVVGERGVKFSGGQRQRIAIARALYFGPEILILDEATSALDNDTETAVMKAIDSLHGNMTLIIIAHRLTTIRNCDRVYEIVNGKAIDRRVDDVIT